MEKLDRGEGAYRIEDGYRLEKVITGLSYPTNITFDPDGSMYYSEAGFTYPFIYKEARICRLAAGNEPEVIAEGFNGPLIGLRWHEGGFLVTHRGTLSRVEPDGTITHLIENLPAFGDHHTNHLVMRDGKVYFGQGTVTNTAIVGSDNLTTGS